MLFSFTQFIITGGIFCCFLTSIILLNKKQIQVYSNRLLGLFLLFTCWYVIMYMLITTGNLVHFPFLLKIGAPFYYLVPPLGYLYVRSVLKDELRLQKKDYWHALPALVALVDIIYYYITTPLAEQQRTADYAVHNFSGLRDVANSILPTAVHYILRPALGIIYVAAQWLLIWKARAKPGNPVTQFHQVRKWLLIFTSQITLLYVLLGCITTLGWNLSGITLIHIASVPLFASSVSFFILSSYLFFHPALLYGIPLLRVSPHVASYRLTPAGAAQQPMQWPVSYSGNSSGLQSQPAECINDVETESRGKIVKEASFAELVNVETSSAVANSKKKKLLGELAVQRVIDKIEVWLSVRSYLRTGLTADIMAAELQIPLHHLSFILNEHYGKRFNEFINSYRIEYCMDAIQNDILGNMTMEGLAQTAGFGSRHTFIAAFKKYTGMTPTDYLKYLKKK